MTSLTARGWFIPLLVVCSCALAGIGEAEIGEPHGPAHHEPLAERRDLTLARVIDQALARYPEVALLPAQAAQAEAWRQRSSSLIAGIPQLSFRYQTDRWGDGDGLKEYEGGLQLPLWRPGERAAAKTLAGAMSSVAATADTGLRWRIAGELRQVLWDLAVAEAEVQSARDNRAVLDQLATAVQRRHELGDVAIGEVLLAAGARLAAEGVVVEAEAMLVDAQRQYRALSGLDARPSFEAEVLSSAPGVTATHPALAAAEAQLERARSRAELVRRNARGSPSLLIGPRWERPPMTNGYEDSIGMTLTVPLPGTAHASTTVADAQAAAAAALAARDRVLRQLDMALHEAEHGLEVARAQLETFERRATLTARHARLGRSAYDLGEMDLMDLLRLEEAAISARRARDRAAIAVNRQIAAYNQAVGALP